MKGKYQKSSSSICDKVSSSISQPKSKFRELVVDFSLVELSLEAGGLEVEGLVKVKLELCFSFDELGGGGGAAKAGFL